MPDTDRFRLFTTDVIATETWVDNIGTSQNVVASLWIRQEGHKAILNRYLQYALNNESIYFPADSTKLVGAPFFLMFHFFL